jgi:electron transport complex protein RnfC
MTQSNQPGQASDVGRHLHHFHGGLRLRHHKWMSCQLAVAKPSMPELLIVPLLQHAGEIAGSMVKTGDHVLKGQQIGPCLDPSGNGRPCAAIHAPTSGYVEAVEDRPMTHPSGKSGPCVVIRPDGKDQWVELQPIEDWRSASHDSLIEQLQRCGIAGLGGAVFPTHAKTRDGRERKIHTLILNGAECEPYISCDEMLMREQPGRILLGARILRRAMGAEHTVIAIEDQMGAVYEALAYAAQQSDCINVSVVRVAKI